MILRPCAPAVPAVARSAKSTSANDSVRNRCMAVSRSGGVVSARDDEERQQIADEHRREVAFRGGVRAAEFLPDENAPQRRDHRRRLPDRVRDRDADEAGGHEIENSSRSPDDSAEQTEQMIGGTLPEVAAEIDGRADERLFHEVDVDDKTAEQRAEREEYGDAVRRQRVAGGERA